MTDNNNLNDIFDISTREIQTRAGVHKVNMYTCKNKCGYSAVKILKDAVACPGCKYQYKIKTINEAMSNVRTKSGAPLRTGGNFREVNKED
tara:strand:- start:2609 stop:2881 length:273 start_codon:yes stop_codon:yes gene_type:complete